MKQCFVLVAYRPPSLLSFSGSPASQNKNRDILLETRTVKVELNVVSGILKMAVEPQPR